jgi:hypothetical protein
VGNNADADDDNDNMPDDWEVQYGLNPLVDDAAAEPDGDQISNLSEYLGGTGPLTYEDLFEPDAQLLITPIDDEVTALMPTLQTDAFYDPDAGDVHTRTQWRIFRAADDLCVFDITSSFLLLEVQVPRLILEEDTDYVWQARFFNNHDTASEWSFQGTFATDYAGYADVDGNGVPDDQDSIDFIRRPEVFVDKV